MLSRNITNSRHSPPFKFELSVWFLLALGLLMFASDGLAVWALYAAAVHEAAHLIVIYACGYGIGRVSLNAGGARISLRGEPSRRALFFIVLSGCAGNIAAAAAVKLMGGQSLRAYIFIGANILLCALNILPHSSLDGGKLLRLMLAESAKSDKIIFISDTVCVFLLTACGVLIFLLGGKNPTALLLGLCLVAKLPVFEQKKH